MTTRRFTILAATFFLALAVTTLAAPKDGPRPPWDPSTTRAPRAEMPRFATPATQSAKSMALQPVIFDVPEMNCTYVPDPDTTFNFWVKTVWRNADGEKVPEPKGKWRLSLVGTGCCLADPLHPIEGSGWIIATLFDELDPTCIWVDSIKVSLRYLRE